MPAWTAYSRVWERLAATFLSLYVLAGVHRRRRRGGRRRDLVLGPLLRLTGARARLPRRDSDVPFVKCPRRHSARRPDWIFPLSDPIADAVQSGAGLPEVLRAAARALDASLAISDRVGTVLAVAARSPADERSLMADVDGVEALELRVADEPVGTLRIRARNDPGVALLRLVCTLVASEVERLRAPDRASAAALGSFLRAVLSRDLSGREDIVARASELGVDLDAGVFLLRKFLFR